MTVPRALFCLFMTCLLCMQPQYPSGEIRAVHAMGQKASGTNQDHALSTQARTGEKERPMSESGRFTEEEGKYLITTARETIEQRLYNRQAGEKADETISPKYQEKRGTFVTLTIDGGLRGCIGHIIPQESVLEGVKANAINAAFRDPRFRPLTREEWEKVAVEVSILTDPQPLAYSGGDDLLSKLRPDVDGVIIKKGYRQATFLPQVWSNCLMPRSS